MTDVSPISDEELFRRSAGGDEDAFTALYRRRQPAVYRFALHMSGRPDLAEEVTQDVFLTLIREPDRFDAGRGALSAFLIGVARNFVLRHIERDRRHVYMEDGDGFDPEAEGPDLLTELSREQAVDAVRQAVLTLPAAYREAVVLCDLEEMSYAGAADIMGVPVGTVRSRLNRGRGMLLDKLRSMQAARVSARCSA
jgi:RNA polymerase sigma-70 factor (ECF subfamily)